MEAIYFNILKTVANARANECIYRLPYNQHGNSEQKVI